MPSQVKCPVCESRAVETAIVLGFRTQPGYLDCECEDCRHTWCMILTDRYIQDLRRVSGLER